MLSVVAVGVATVVVLVAGAVPSVNVATAVMLSVEATFGAVNSWHQPVLLPPPHMPHDSASLPQSPLSGALHVPQISLASRA